MASADHPAAAAMMAAQAEPAEAADALADRRVAVGEEAAGQSKYP